MKTEMLPDSISKRENPARRARWMVVDDDDSVRDFVAGVLEMRGAADVASFRSGPEALAAFTAMPDQFEFVITDLDMPGMNGIELCRRLRAMAPQLKVVLATGNGAANETGAQQCGFFGLLAKPFPAADVWRMVEAAGVGSNPTSLAVPQ
jgi:CheY-like chemotaxis protein